MAQLLPRCLDSLLESGAQADFEAIVVNDGSKDNTLQVALKYRDANPDCIRVIDKPNGNYGSTINAALPQARGKYVKILDADDWFAPAALAKFLRELSGTDADMVVTHFTQIHPKGVKELAKYNLYGKAFRRLYPFLPYALAGLQDTAAGAERLPPDGGLFLHGLGMGCISSFLCP